MEILMIHCIRLRILEMLPADCPIIWKDKDVIRRKLEKLEGEKGTRLQSLCPSTSSSATSVA